MTHRVCLLTGDIGQYVTVTINQTSCLMKRLVPAGTNININPRWLTQWLPMRLEIPNSIAFDTLNQFKTCSEGTWLQ